MLLSSRLYHFPTFSVAFEWLPVKLPRLHLVEQRRALEPRCSRVQFPQGHGTSQWVPHLGTGHCCALAAQALLRFTTFPRKNYSQWAHRGSSLPDSKL